MPFMAVTDPKFVLHMEHYSKLLDPNVWAKLLLTVSGASYKAISVLL